MIIFEGNKYTDYFSESELLARVQRSRAYTKAFEKEYYAALQIESRVEIDNRKTASDDGSGLRDSRQSTGSNRAVLDPSGGLSNRDVGANGSVRQVSPHVPNPSNSGENRPRLACGIVAIVDFMNLFMRAWHAGQPSEIHAVRSMLDTIGNMIDRICPEFIVFALDGGSDHRRRLLNSYKDRPAKPPEVLAQIKLAEQALQVIGWPAVRVIGWEADDVMASLATQFDKVAIGTVLVSCDKDILQVCANTQARVYHPWGEGLHFNEQKCIEKYGVRFNQINAFLSLRGDSTDGVPGVPGIGDKTAAELLKAHGTFEGVLAAAAAGQVKGKAGKVLVEHAHMAKLSRELVTLRTDLPVGDHWQQFPLDQPRRGWEEGLKRLKLFASANRLKDRLPVDSVDHGNKPSQVDIEWFAIGFDQANAEFTVAELPSPAPSMAAAPATIDDGRPSPAPAVSREISDPSPPAVASDPTAVASWYPSLAACPLDASLLDKVRAVYRTGLDYFHERRQVENGWRSDSLYFVAYDDGLNGRALSVVADDCTEGNNNARTIRRRDGSDLRSAPTLPGTAPDESSNGAAVDDGPITNAHADGGNARPDQLDGPHEVFGQALSNRAGTADRPVKNLGPASLAAAVSPGRAAELSLF